MTVHSTQKRVTRREQFDKAVHATAHRDNVRYQQALGEYAVPHNTQGQARRTGHTSRPVADYSLRPWELLEDIAEPELEDVYDFEADFGASPTSGQFTADTKSVSLLDLVKPLRNKDKVAA